MAEGNDETGLLSSDDTRDWLIAAALHQSIMLPMPIPENYTLSRLNFGELVNYCTKRPVAVYQIQHGLDYYVQELHKQCDKMIKTAKLPKAPRAPRRNRPSAADDDNSLPSVNSLVALIGDGRMAEHELLRQRQAERAADEAAPMVNQDRLVDEEMAPPPPAPPMENDLVDNAGPQPPPVDQQVHEPFDEILNALEINDMAPPANPLGDGVPEAVANIQPADIEVAPDQQPMPAAVVQVEGEEDIAENAIAAPRRRRRRGTRRRTTPAGIVAVPQPQPAAGDQGLPQEVPPQEVPQVVAMEIPALELELEPERAQELPVQNVIDANPGLNEMVLEQQLFDQIDIDEAAIIEQPAATAQPLDGHRAEAVEDVEQPRRRSLPDRASGSGVVERRQPPRVAPRRLVKRDMSFEIAMILQNIEGNAVVPIRAAKTNETAEERLARIREHFALAECHNDGIVKLNFDGKTLVSYEERAAEEREQIQRHYYGDNTATNAGQPAPEGDEDSTSEADEEQDGDDGDEGDEAMEE